MATQSVTLPNGSVVLISSNFPNTVQGGQVFPATVTQPAGTVMYLPYGGQQVGSAPNQPQQMSQVGPLEKFRQAEIKTLGAIQIMIGLIHIGFGVLSVILFVHSYFGIAAVGGYPFWGGLFFIISGSLSVNAVEHLRTQQVKCSVGMNITSAIMSLFGIALYLVELIVNPSSGYYYGYDYYENLNWMPPIGIGFSALLFLFSVLEFCIAVWIAHFGCQATCCNTETDLHMVPYIIPAVATNYPESSAPPYPAPAYSAHEPSNANLKV